MTRPANSGLASALSLIAKKLHTDSGSVTQEPLPDRWTDLIQRLEQERRSSDRPGQREPGKRDR
jgi:hypothetical protein